MTRFVTEAMNTAIGMAALAVVFSGEPATALASNRCGRAVKENVGKEICHRAALTADASPSRVSAEDLWILLRAREWMFRLGSDEWSGDIAAGIKDAPALLGTDPALRELKPLLTSIATREPASIAPRQAPEQIPRPWWKLAWVDVDGDGKQEIVLAGGTSPAPYYAVFQHSEGADLSWRILHEAPFRFLGSATHAGRIYLFGVFDGYGVDTPVLAIDSIAAAAQATDGRIRIDLPEWPEKNSEPAPIAVGTTTKVTKLRAQPKQDDKLTDRGMGSDLPGNLIQTLAAGSTGWVLYSQKGKDGQGWALCCFVGPSPMGSEHPLKEMLAPRKLSRQPLTLAKNLIVGWIRARDLVER
jgi:hypothetical protein